MPRVNFCFHVHQPFRLSRFNFFRIGSGNGDGAALENNYFDEGLNRHYFNKAADQCYLPANAILQELLDRYHGDFKFTISITGTFIEQAQRYRPEVLESFRRLVSTGHVDILDETYTHSLASLFSDMSEFKDQVALHSHLIQSTLGYKPKSFRNTEVIYSNRIAKAADEMGYAAIITEGTDATLGWRSPNYVYKPKGCNSIRLLMRNYRLSDDVGFRFSAKGWSEWPLTAPKYASWLSASQGEIINLFMDYETFGEHHWKDTGILDFLRHLPREVLQHRHLSFSTITESAKAFEPADEVDVPYNVSWADAERDTSTWLGNRIQRSCFGELESLLPKVRAAKNPSYDRVYRQLLTSDHFMYLSTKGMSDREVHNYFSPYKDANPYENYINFMNIINDFRFHVEKASEQALSVPPVSQAGSMLAQEAK